MNSVTQIISIDIGSTYTKGILCEIGEAELQIIRRGVVPTTVACLPDGFLAVVAQLLELPELTDMAGLPDDIPIWFSSSAKGGLNIAAIGIVPELTLKVAKMTALSAGGKICEVFPYKLSKSDIRRLEEHNPDILLFTGGTDGGNEAYNIANAEKLANSNYKGAIIYAGNRACVDEIEEILENKNLIITENVLPELDQTNPEPARDIIRQVFLKQIVEGKGLSKVVEFTGNEPLPTPLSMFEFISLFPEVDPLWQDFCVIDMGGATTDFYSNHEDVISNEQIVFRGIKEPKVKRTVEGDLGMRVTAKYTQAVAGEYIQQQLTERGLSSEKFESFIEQLAAGTDYLPEEENEEEKAFDEILAQACVYHATMRHSGSLEEIYTAHGISWLQRGKNINRANRIIGTGGFLSRRAEAMQAVSHCKLDEKHRTVLKPEDPVLFADSEYLMPLLSNLARIHPKQAVRTAISHLTEFTTNECKKEPLIITNGFSQPLMNTN